MCGVFCDPVRLSSWYFGNTFLKDLECYFSAEFLHWDTLDILWRSPKAHSIARISRYTCTCYNFAISAHLCTSVDMTSSGVKDKGDPHQSHWASIVSSFGQQRINIASRAANATGLVLVAKDLQNLCGYEVAQKGRRHRRHRRLNLSFSLCLDQSC